MKGLKGKEYNRIQTLSAAFLAFLGTLCLPMILNLQGETLVISNSWFGVFFWAVCFYLLSQTEKERERKITAGEKRGRIVSHVISFLFATALVFGAQLDSRESVDFTNGMVWLAILVWGLIFGSFTFWAYGALERICLCEKLCLHEKPEGGEDVCKKGIVGKWNSLSERKQTVLVFCFYLLCWLPVFLAVYPGFFVYDAQDEFVQVETRNFTTHHPLPHVTLLGGIILAVHKLTGSYNLGIAAYTLFQMILMAGVFTYVIYDMKKRKVSGLLRVLTALYFALFPVIVMFTLCSAKDGIFSAAFLLLLLSMTEMVEQKKNFLRR